LRPLPFSGGLTFALIFWGTFASWVVPEINAWWVKRSTEASTSRDRGSLGLITFLWWLGIALDFLFSLLLPQTGFLHMRALLFTVGVCMMLLGIALRWYSAAMLGKYFTFDVAIQSGQPLIEAGPYRYIRHPSYSGALLTLLGFGLALGNWLGLTVALVCLGSAYAYRISVEEAALASALGNAYDDYVKRTRRLVPFLF
jgi:protein-S-isoprenylcysteine O-methyltransferase